MDIRSLFAKARELLSIRNDKADAEAKAKALGKRESELISDLTPLAKSFGNFTVDGRTFTVKVEPVKAAGVKPSADQLITAIAGDPEWKEFAAEARRILEKYKATESAQRAKEAAAKPPLDTLDVKDVAVAGAPVLTMAGESVTLHG